MIAPEEFTCNGPDGTLIRGDRVNEVGTDAILLLHGLTSHRRLVLMGSRKLERLGYPIIRYDARGHGISQPAQGGGYSYEALAADALEVLRVHNVERAVVVGVSMGAHTAAALTLAKPNLISGLVLITPAFDPTAEQDDSGRWAELADGLQRSRVDGFIDALDLDAIDQRWRDTVKTASRQRMEAHKDLSAIATALREVPASRPFERFEQLQALAAPTTVIGSRDDADPTHPETIARAWADALPGATFLVEDRGESPLAWRGAAISDAVIATLDRCEFRSTKA